MCHSSLLFAFQIKATHRNRNQEAGRPTNMNTQNQNPQIPSRCMDPSSRLSGPNVQSGRARLPQFDVISWCQTLVGLQHDMLAHALPPSRTSSISIQEQQLIPCSRASFTAPPTVTVPWIPPVGWRTGQENQRRGPATDCLHGYSMLLYPSSLLVDLSYDGGTLAKSPRGHSAHIVVGVAHETARTLGNVQGSR